MREKEHRGEKEGTKAQKRNSAKERAGARGEEGESKYVSREKVSVRKESERGERM